MMKTWFLEFHFNPSIIEDKSVTGRLMHGLHGNGIIQFF